MKVEVLEHPTDEDWLKAKQRALVTIGLKSDRIPDIEWRKKMLNCRHSPIRKLAFSFYLSDIPYWLHTELVRHHEGFQPYVGTQRDDRCNNEIPRGKKPQDTPVNMIVDINAEALLTLMNKRLCGCAAKEMQQLMLMIRSEVIHCNPEFADFLVPMCVFLRGCREFKPCQHKAVYFEVQ